MSEYDTSPWPAKDIVYTTIVGVFMIPALFEWFLWLAAFEFCLLKCFIKAEHWSTNVLAVVVGFLFAALRLAYLPVMIFTLPLPGFITQYFPETYVSFFQYFGAYSFAGLLTVPWLCCVYQIVIHQVGRTKRIKQILDEQTAPKIVIVMPCYNEKPEVLITALDSVVDCEYPASCIHVFLSFDGDRENALYLNTIEKLGVPRTLGSYPKSIDVTYRTARITVSRFPHGGKRHCQKLTFKLIDKVYTEYLKRNDNLFILFIDSDCILDRFCLQNFIYDMEMSPGNNRNMLAMTGVITSTTRKHNFITLLQDMEYVHGQLFERTVESGCGSVTCLPGALTMLRFSALRTTAKLYFSDKAEQCDDLFDYGKCHLGEDRWLTHLFMVGARERYQIQMCTSAFCKTEAVQNMTTLIKQRRRWFLGFITNEACMLTDWRIWKTYPLLTLLRLAQNSIRTTSLLLVIMLFALATTEKKVADLPIGFIAISLGLNWALMCWFAWKLKRWKLCLYPLMFIVNPFFNWFYMVYGIFTAGQRTWGGPRADAGAADEITTVREVIEKAEAAGDELNVIPESFRPAVEAQRHAPQPAIPLHPPKSIEGRFAAPVRLPGGWYQQASDSTASVEDTLPTQSRLPLHPRASFESLGSIQTTGSVHTPRRVESLMGEEDRIQYALTQAGQRPAGGAYMMAPNYFQDQGHGIESSPQGSSEEQVLSSAQRPEPHRVSSYASIALSTDGSSDNIPLSTSGLFRSQHNEQLLPSALAGARSTGSTRSPLARVTFTRVGEEVVNIEMRDQSQQ